MNDTLNKKKMCTRKKSEIDFSMPHNGYSTFQLQAYQMLTLKKTTIVLKYLINDLKN